MVGGGDETNSRVLFETLSVCVLINDSHRMPPCPADAEYIC